MSFELFCGDSLEVLGGLGDCGIDAVVTDPPYGLVEPRSLRSFGYALENGRSEEGKVRRRGGFMGKMWDSGVPGEAFWRAALRVSKPGAHLLAFGGTRTYHRLICAIEDAGWEVRDCLMWVYGCLDERSEAVTERGVVPFHKLKVGERVLCYDISTGAYCYQGILEVLVYDYEDTAYRLIGDFGEQVVSRGHRCIVERNGREEFCYAEALSGEESVPVLEGVRELRQAIYDAHEGASGSEQVLLQGLRSEGAQEEGDESSQGCVSKVCGLREGVLAGGCAHKEGEGSCMQPFVQREVAGSGACEALQSRAVCVDGGVACKFSQEDDWREQSGVEGGGDLFQEARELSCNQVCSLSGGVVGYGEEGRVCDGTSLDCCDGYGACFTEDGGCSSHQSRPDGQLNNQPSIVCDEPATQGIRGWGGHRSAVVRVVPFQYTGKMWCVRVSTGAFVAFRDGVYFPTGNSGFPKSHDVSKAIDGVLGKQSGGFNTAGGKECFDKQNKSFRSDYGYAYNPSSPSAVQWSGWGTALKPAWEPIVLARKPLEGTVAQNVLKWGVGGINVDGCRVGTDVGDYNHSGNLTKRPMARNSFQAAISGSEKVTQAPPSPLGRWPANLIHDGSWDVLGLFPETGAARKNKQDDERIHENLNAEIYGRKMGGRHKPENSHNDNGGSAARFFYCAKASKSDRDEGCEGLEEKACGLMEDDNYAWPDGRDVKRRNSHPTVKPTALMRYLCRLVTPPNGLILDPFMGSGSTGKAAMLEGFRFIGIDKESEYVEIARRRIGAVSSR